MKAIVCGGYRLKPGVRALVYTSQLDLTAYVPAAEVAKMAGLDPKECVLIEAIEPMPKLAERLPVVTLKSLGRV